jgi:hypothetical protein
MEIERGSEAPAQRISCRLTEEAGVRSIMRHREGHRTGRIGWLRARFSALARPRVRDVRLLR